MIRLVVLYPQSGGNWFDMDYYKKNHIPLVKKLFEPLGMEKIELDAGIAGMEGPAPYFAIAYLHFRTMDQLQKAMAQHAKTLTDDMVNYTKDAIIQIGENIKI
jgi:uncharacterized protein (TIGR02118 family)